MKKPKKPPSAAAKSRAALRAQMPTSLRRLAAEIARMDLHPSVRFYLTTEDNTVRSLGCIEAVDMHLLDALLTGRWRIPTDEDLELITTIGVRSVP